MKKIIVLNENDESVFEEKCSDLIDKGYVLHSSSCSFVNSDEYNFCSVLQAIFILKECCKSE